MRAKKIISLILAAVICVSFAGCRARTTKTGVQTAQAVSQKVENTKAEEEIKTETPVPEMPEENTDTKKNTFNKSDTTPRTFRINKKITAKNTVKKTDNSGDRKKGTGGKSPNSKNGDIRKENGSNDKDSKSQDLDNKDDTKEDTPTQTAIREYSKLLSVGISNVEACHRYEVYCEKDDFNAFNDENIIYKAGGINIDKNKSDVTSQWIKRENPRVIVKFVDDSVLGSGVTSTSEAESIMNSILSRDGWGETEAVENKRVVLLSSSLMKSSAGKTYASVIVGKMLHFALFGDINTDEAYSRMFGKNIDGIYYFVSTQYQYEFADAVLYN